MFSKQEKFTLLFVKEEKKKKSKRNH